MTTYLKFVNKDATPKSREIALHDDTAVADIMAWYGGYYAGDRYSVFVNGEKIQIDRNGEPVLPL